MRIRQTRNPLVTLITGGIGAAVGIGGSVVALLAMGWILHVMVRAFMFGWSHG